MVPKFFLLLCAAALFPSANSLKKTSDDVERLRLPEFLTELDVASAEASLEDVEALKKIVKRLAPEKDGEYQAYQVFFGNEKLLREWLKGSEVQGQPGVDYPSLTTIPVTSFSCRGQKGGYYADLETNCQVFHICDNGRKISFLCPNGTIFQQSQLICDWWFKVDCSKSAELYEQSAEFLAQEEKKRLELKKMNSEYHRPTDDNYDGRQNGRNPSAIQNQLPNSQNKFSQSYEANGIFDGQSSKSTSQSFQTNNINYDQNGGTRTTAGVTQSRGTTRSDYRQTNRQQNQLTDNSKNKGSTYKNDDYSKNQQRGSTVNDYHDNTRQSKQYDSKDNSGQYYNSNQGKSSQEDEYYGSAANVNTQRDEKQNSKTRTHTFTRNNFNSPVQKVTPVYTETTTFRTTTVSPIREFQQLAESAAFASSRGNQYNKAQSSSQYNSYFNNRVSSQKSQQTTTTTTPTPFSNDAQSFVRTRTVPPFPGATFAPIYKPRTTTITPRDTSSVTSTTQQPYQNTDYYRQNSQEQTTYNYDGTSYTDYTTETPPYTNPDDIPRNTDVQNTFETDQYRQTTIPTTQGSYTTDFYKQSPTVTQKSQDNTQYYNRETSKYTDNNNNYSGAQSTVEPTVYRENYKQNTGISNSITDNKLKTPSVSYSSDIQAQDTSRFASGKSSTNEPFKPCQACRSNSISSSTEKPNYPDNNETFQSNTPRRTLSPYDSSVTYQHGKVMSTLGPYIPFTKNYVYSTTSASTTQRSPVYTPTVPTTGSSSSNFRNSKSLNTSKSFSYFIPPSAFAKSAEPATYLPKKTTLSTSAVTAKPTTEATETLQREHAIRMLQSLQGLEGSVPNLNLVNNTRSDLDIPSSSGPSTLHSLALYFATEEKPDGEKIKDVIVNEKFTEGPENSALKNDNAIDLPTSILTQHTISSYAELFNLNNALENNITVDGSYEQSDEAAGDDDSSDLDIQQSEGPLNGVRKSNNTKLRELAQVFTQALSAYLQDPETFKKVLTEIRPTVPPLTAEELAELTTLAPTTTEEYPSVTKEKDEVLDFSDDTNGPRRRRPTTTPYPTTDPITERGTDIQKETTYPAYQTSDYYSTSDSFSETKYPTTTEYPDESLNEAQSGYVRPMSQQIGNDFAFQVNNIFESGRSNEVQNYNQGSSNTKGNFVNDYDNYFPTGSNRLGGFQNNSISNQTPYGKYVKPFDATPISENYVASSTPATYAQDAYQTTSYKDQRLVTKLSEELTPPIYSNYASTNNVNTVVTNAFSPTPSTGSSCCGRLHSSGTAPVYRGTQELPSTSTTQSFRIRYYDTTTPKPSESLVTANSVYSTYDKNYVNNQGSSHPTDRASRDFKSNNKNQIQYSKDTTLKPTSQQVNNHWTSSPAVAQLWETTVFVHPENINRGLDGEAGKVTEPSNVNYRESTPATRELLATDASSGLTQKNSLTDSTASYKWSPNNSDSPTSFTLLPSVYSTENTATPTPTYTTRSSITTTITSSLTSTNSLPQDSLPFPGTFSILNITENEIVKAHEMFGNLNETSSNVLMKVMKQAENNVTVRQLVLLLISHCKGPMNKTMEEEKEQLLNALLKMPVNEFSTQESREIVAGISKLSLPIGKTTFAVKSTTTSTPEPVVTTYRSRKGRKHKSPTTDSTPYSKVTTNARRPGDGAAESKIDDGTISDSRALELLRSLYTIAAKWG